MNFFSFFFPTPPPHHFSNGPSLIDSWSGWNFLTRTATASGIRRIQGIKRPGNEMGSSLLVQSVMQRRTDTSAPSAPPVQLLGSFRKPRRRRRRQRERHQTKGLMSRTMAVHARFESLYISLPSSAKQQREMTKFYVFWRTRTAMANFWYLL